MNRFNKSYRIRTEVGKDTQLHINLDRDYDTLELMSLKINQENAYKLHSANYGVIAGRVLANEALGIPNAKVSVFINIDGDDINDVVKSVLYPYNTTMSKDINGVRYNLLPNEKIEDCHTVIGTFPGKQFLLDNDNVLEVFEKYYKFTTRTNDAGDYMIFGVPIGSQTIHVDIDLSDIGILSQKPRDMIYKGYNIEQFDNPNKFKYDTNLDSLTQVISQDDIVDVIPFWGEESENSIGITRCDVNIQYKFEPTCVFMGSVVSDTASNGISKKCIPTPGMGSMEDITTGSGTIEMIRKTPYGDVEEFQIKGTQLINGDGVWCYQIPMNLDYMMTDEYGNMVPTNDPKKGVPTRTRVRFRISMQDFENTNSNMFRCKVLVPHNPDIYSNSCDSELDYQFGTNTKEKSFKDLFWNGVYSVKSYIPRIQKGANWKNEKFTGFKRINYHGDKNPMPYNNIRIRIPFMYTIMCLLIKFFIKTIGTLNWIFMLCGKSFVKQDDDSSGSFINLTGSLCNDNLDTLCIIPGVNIKTIADNNKKNRTTLLGISLLKHYNDLGGDIDLETLKERDRVMEDEKSIDYNNGTTEKNAPDKEIGDVITDSSDGKTKTNARVDVKLKGIKVTDKIDYLIQCIEMNLAQEFKVIQFDFYNDWINGLIYIPRWMRNVTKKRTFLWGAIKVGGKVKACNENFKKSKRNIVQQCGLEYNFNPTKSTFNITNEVGCTKNKLRCHKSVSVRKKYSIFRQNGLVKSIENSKKQYIYYFKPYESSTDFSTSKNIRLFATDIILLGTLNNCDKFGLTNELTELVSSTYQMPPNLALTDADLEGNDYEANVDNNEYIKMTVRENKGVVTDIELNDCYVGISPMKEYGNYTEISGIDWGYTGPLQSSNTDSKLYKPGGHFLGISCRNSETSIKTCVNLSRICEHGVWMSQRHELNIPSTNKTFLDYATVPSGIISKDEISDTNYRRLFASMNKNKLRTRLNKENGLLEYDFEYVNPTNFSGELSGHISNDTLYNRSISGSVTEKYYNYTDDDYFKAEQESFSNVNKETQIMRTGEFFDKEYVKFRYGFTDETLTSAEQQNKRFLLTNGANKSFPMYDNSFYFYFGLHDGKTALDEFKKQYYSVCEKSNDLVQNDDSIGLYDIKTEYDGVCSEKGSGKLSFKLKKVNVNFNGKFDLSLEYLDDSSVSKKVKTNVSAEGTGVTFSDLKSGNYALSVSAKTNNETILTDSFNFNIDKIKVTANLSKVNFKKDVSSEKNIFTLDRRENYGGYIKINGNVFSYENNSENKTIDIFESGIVHSITIKFKYTENNTEIKQDYSTKNEDNIIISSYDRYDVQIYKEEENGSYMIPVPKYGVDYDVYINTYYDSETCKLIESGKDVKQNTKYFEWHIGSVKIDNATKMSFIYNGIVYNSLIKYIGANDTNGTSQVSFNGWWNKKNENGIEWEVEESNDFKWRMKEALFMSNEKHNVPLISSGGEPPRTDIISGNTENDLDNITEIGISSLNNIKIPTINYNTNGKRRVNFSYQVMDSNGQITPNQPFIFPVIYKPFFHELCLIHHSKSNRYFLHGNIYNGLTWTLIEGFNDVKLNSQPIYNLATVSEKDTTLEIRDEYIENKEIKTGGGYDYSGPYFKYNGRKVYVSKEIEPTTHSLNNISNVNVSLSIGNNHTESGITYSNYTNTSQENTRFINFEVIEYISGVTTNSVPINEIYITKEEINNKGVITYKYQAHSICAVTSDIVVTVLTGDKSSVFNIASGGTKSKIINQNWKIDLAVEKMLLNKYKDATQFYEAALYEGHAPSSTRTVNITNTKYYFKFNTPEGNNCEIYYLFDSNASQSFSDAYFKYPFDSVGNLIIDSRLFKNIIEEFAHGVNLPELKMDKESGFIDISAGYIDKNNEQQYFSGKTLYGIAVSNTKPSTCSNQNNVLKAVSVSDKIEFNDKVNFYPLDLIIFGDDVYYEESQQFKTMLSIKPDIGSEENFKNKIFEIYLYGSNIGISSIPSATIRVESESNSTKLMVDITQYRAQLGINFTADSNNRDSKNFRFDYDVYDKNKNSLKAPYTYERYEMIITHTTK